ncbi:hypothetical protein [Methylopila sp. M107]|uniref:hypothetical protein n=1 Tax=Methylopila sp. M107 TaxID=1101190 RepID=UPI00035E9F65|nr:hypothetical protein [Methylopila sp. M107]
MSNVTDFPYQRDQRSASERSEELFGEWLTLRAHRYIDRPGISRDDEIASENQKDEIAMRLAARPAHQPQLILHKIQMLEAELIERQLRGGHILHTLIAGIKADVQDLAEASE